MACFSCSKEKSIETTAILQWYKDASIKSGKIFWFFKLDSSNEIKIMCNDDFKIFKSENSEDFSNGKYEFSRIDEFRIT
jgi:hypothetical protein